MCTADYSLEIQALLGVSTHVAGVQIHELPETRHIPYSNSPTCFCAITTEEQIGSLDYRRYGYVRPLQWHAADIRQLFSQKSQSVWLLSSKQGGLRLSRCPRLTQPVVISHRLLSMEGKPCKYFFLNVTTIAKWLTAAREHVIYSVSVCFYLFDNIPVDLRFIWKKKK